MKKIALFVPAILLLSSCLNKETVEKTVIWPETNVTEVNISADFIPENLDSTKIVKVRSNRSWTAHLNDRDNPVGPDEQVSWAYLKNSGYTNVSKNTQETDLVIVFRPNLTRIPKNGVIEFFCEGEKCKELDVHQAGIIFRLEASIDKTEAAAEGEVIPIKIDCNTNWTVKAAEGNTADLRFETESGFSVRTINLKVLENEDKTAKIAKIAVCAEDCADVILTINQAPSAGDVKFWEAVPKFSFINGSNADIDHFPLLLIDTEKTGQDIIDAGARFFYTSSTKSFEDAGIPISNDPRLSDKGIDLVGSKRVAHSEIYIVILGVCEGYRNTYTRVLVRFWQFGTAFTLSPCYGLGMSALPSDKRTNFMFWDKNLALTAKTQNAGHGMMYSVIHNDSFLPTCRFSVGGDVLNSWTFNAKKEYYSAISRVCISNPYYAGKDVELEYIALNDTKAFIWQLAFMESAKYKL